MARKNTLELDPLNPAHRKILEKSESGRKGLREYYNGKNLNQEVQTHIGHRINDKNMMEMTESSKKGQKYGNVRCVDELFGTNQEFDSIWERTCFYRLMELQRKNVISGLKCQVKAKLYVNDEHICDFVIDFRFIREGVEYYVDAKSSATMPAGARYKVNHFRASHTKHLYLAYSHKSSIIDILEGKNYAIEERSKQKNNK